MIRIDWINFFRFKIIITGRLNRNEHQVWILVLYTEYFEIFRNNTIPIFCISDITNFLGDIVNSGLTILLKIWRHLGHEWGMIPSFMKLSSTKPSNTLAITIAFIPYNCYLLYSNIFSFCYFRNWWEVKTLLWRSPKSFTICSASSQEIKPCSLNCSILFFSLLNNKRTDLRATASLYDLG